MCAGGYVDMWNTPPPRANDSGVSPDTSRLTFQKRRMTHSFGSPPPPPALSLLLQRKARNFTYRDTKGGGRGGDRFTDMHALTFIGEWREGRRERGAHINNPAVPQKERE